MTSIQEATAGTLPRPPAGQRTSAPQRLYALLTSPRLALALLVTILACCVVGVTALRGERAWRLIFSTLWFNALLVLLALSSAAAFFTRVWRRKLTLVQAGMIVFHLSFAALLGGVVYNALFKFNGVLRLTEGETVHLGDLANYDVVQIGQYFDPRRLRGETTLHRMHRGYVVDGQEKRAAYEIAVGEGDRKASGVIYITQDLEHDGIRYLCAKEGYSILLVMHDKQGRELYGAHVPLQSIRLQDGGFLYATGKATEPLSFPFPFPPEPARTELLMTFRPNAVKDREGEVGLHLAEATGGGATVIDLHRAGGGRAGKDAASVVSVGERFDAGEFTLTPSEVRYWVGIDVRHDPGLNLILGSLCLGLAGMVLTFVGRIRQGSPRQKAA